MHRIQAYTPVARAIGVSVIAIASMTSIARAQDQAAATAPVAVAAADDGSQLGDIIVTARKSSEKLQEVPITVNAFTAETLQKQDIRSLPDLFRLTPALNFQDIGSRQSPRLQIRGLTTSTTGGSKVSVFLDGNYIGADISALSFADLQRVEVLKGPQSAVFGRSTFAGAINYVTQSPGDELTGRISGTLASYGEREVVGYVSTPIVKDLLGLTVSGRYYNYDAPDSWKNFPDGTRIGAQKTGAGSAKLVLTPSPDIKVTGYFAYNRDHDSVGPIYAFPASSRIPVFTRANGTTGDYFLGPLSAKPGNFAYNLSRFDDPGFIRNSYRGYVRGEATVADHTITATYSHESERKHDEEESDYTSTDLQSYNQNQRFNNDTAEIRIASSPDKPFRYAFGGFYADLQNLSLFQPFYFAGSQIQLGTLTRTKSRSGFASLNYDITDALTVTAEGRYQSEQVRQTNTVSGASFAGTFNKFLPRVNVAYKITPDVNFYALFSRGNNPGGFNTTTGLDPKFFLIKEEVLDNYEAGLKMLLLDRHVRLNIAGFHMNWKNQQNTEIVVIPAVGNTPSFLTTANLNKGSSTIDGVEAEVTVQPTDNFNVRATFSYDNARYKNYCSLNLGTLQTGLTSGQPCVDVSGNKLEAQPPVQVSFSTDYTQPITDKLALFFRGDVSLTDKEYDSEMNLAYTPSFTIVNLHAGVNVGGAEVEVFCRNCTNDETFTRAARFNLAGVPGFTASNAQTVLGTFRRPRQIGARATFNF